jgi:transcription initiation factor TFIIIB Brf1 subunit/transcription initiation factor TFIIB
MEKCKECGGILIKTKEGDLTCGSCGLVHQINTYVNNEYEDSVAIMPTIPLGGKLMPSSYGIFKDFINDPLSENTQNSLRMLKRVDDKLKAYQASSMINSLLLNSIMQISNELNLSKNIVFATLKLYLKSIKYLKSNGYRYTTPTVYAACLLVMSRILGENRVLSLEEITNVFLKHGHRVTKGNIAWCSSIISKKVLNKFFSYKYLVRIYLERFHKLCINNEDINKIIYKKGLEIDKQTLLNLIKKKSLEIIENFDEVKVQGKSPFVFAAAVLYVADKLVAKEMKIKPILSHRLIRQITGVPEFSLREHKSLLKVNGIKN